MKTRVIAVIFACSVVIAGAQERYLLNETDSVLFLAAAPSGAATVEGLPAETQWRQLPARGILPYEPDESIMGFAFERGSFELPTIALTAAASRALLVRSPAGREYVRITAQTLSDENLVEPSAYTDLFARPRVDNRYLDWVSRQASIARGKSRAPLGVYADFGDGREDTTLDQSLLWGRGGTDLEWMKGYTTEHDYFLGGSVYTPIAQGTGVFLYVYGPGNDVPRATLELRVGAAASTTQSGSASSGRTELVLLWLPGRPEPVIAGTLVATQFFFEAQIWRERLTAALGTPVSELSIELSTASNAAGIWEEFVLARDAFTVLFGE